MDSKKLVKINLIILVFAASVVLANKVVTKLVSENEKYRPQFHFSVSKNWMNDPNGMVYYDGEYHLYFQYHPNGTTWGPMHWGHAVSNDLLHWTELPIALYPDELGQIFSGSAVVDYQNVTGFQSYEGIAPIVAFYTSAGVTQQQSLAYSNDKGRTFTKYIGNPIIPNSGIVDFRDPKVIPYEDAWILLLAAGNKILFYKSDNLINWNYLSEFGAEPPEGSHGGVWECPDLLKINNHDQDYWVLLVSINPGGPNGGSATQYFIGNFDGVNFINSNPETRWLDWGTDNYAGITFANNPNGEYILMGWMNNWDYANHVPTGKWRGQMTLPRRLTIKKDVENSDVYLVSEVPNSLLQDLLNHAHVYESSQKYEIKAESVFSFDEIMNSWKNPLLYIELEFNISNFGKYSSIAICFMNKIGQEICAGLDNGRDLDLFLDRSRTGNTGFSDKFWPRPTASRINSKSDVFKFEAFVDTSSIETRFDSDIFLTSIFFPDTSFNKIEIRHHINGSTDSQLFLTSSRLYGVLPTLS